MVRKTGQEANLTYVFESCVFKECAGQPLSQSSSIRYCFLKVVWVTYIPSYETKISTVLVMNIIIVTELRS